MPKRSLPLSSLLLCSALCAQPQTIVSPAGSANVEGTSNNIYPFGTNTPRRYLQIHSDIGGAVRLITKLSFRMNGPSTSTYTGTTAIDTELNMGHSVAWDKASFTFAQNWVTPPVQAVARKTLTWGPQGQGGNPAPFVNMDIPLDAPFTYLGVLHSLAWEAVVYSYVPNGSYAGTMDAEGGSYTAGASAITGTGCIATGQTAAMTHAFMAYDYAGTLLLGWIVSAGPANALTALAVGTTNPNLAFPGLCSNVYTDMAATIVLGITDAVGVIDRETTPYILIPNTLPGAILTSQLFALDPARPDPVQVSTSNGRSTTMPFPNLSKVVKVTRVWNDLRGTTATRGAVTTTTLDYGLVTQFTY